MLNSPSTPTSSTSTRPPATVDGSIRPIEDARPLRSVEAIRADLEHPHTAALTALHSTTIGDGPIGRLLRDVAPLLAEVERLTEDTAMAWRETRRNIEENQRLSALVDRQLGECIGCRYDEGPEETCPQHGRTVTEWIDIASTVIGRQHAIEAERDAALARIAAVEQAVRDARTIAPCPIPSPHTPHGHSPTTAFPGGVALCRGVAALAASPTSRNDPHAWDGNETCWCWRGQHSALHEMFDLAASPTPTGPEPATAECEYYGHFTVAGQRYHHNIAYDGARIEKCGPATPEPTEETP